MIVCVVRVPNTCETTWLEVNSEKCKYVYRTVGQLSTPPTAADATAGSTHFVPVGATTCKAAHRVLLHWLPGEQISRWTRKKSGGDLITMALHRIRGITSTPIQTSRHLTQHTGGIDVCLESDPPRPQMSPLRLQR